MTQLTTTDAPAAAPTSREVGGEDHVRAFRAQVPEADIADLRRRLLATRWPDRETVADASQGAQLTNLQELVRYWATEYDWRRGEAKLNAYPQFMTTIDGVEIHFIHVRSRHPNALPMVIAHGWPGSVFEQIKLIEPLTDPTAHGGRAEDAFDVVIPSLPGFGFSSRPDEPGWGLERIGRAFDVLMKRLGYTRYVAQGGDWGAGIVTAMGRQAPAGLLGIHTNLPAVVTPDVGAALGGSEPALAALSEKERAAIRDFGAYLQNGGLSYLVMMGARPQAVGYSLTDSPAGLAGWMLVHSGFTKWTYGRDPKQSPTRDDVLDNFSLYWLTNTAASAARIYWENRNLNLISAAEQKTNEIKIPVAITAFPDEVIRPQETWARRAFPTLSYFNEADRGGHFAMWEYPELFASELRAAFRSLRSRHDPPTNSSTLTTATRVSRGLVPPGTAEPHPKETTMASTLTEAPKAPAAHAIRPFHFRASDEALADLRRRIQATRFPEKELVADRSQGVQLATLQELARYWTSEYDWRKAEARLNALPQFTTEIDGVEIHFIHVRSRHENALPLIMTHGWPGSVIELLETVGPLTDPTAHGGTAEDAFHVVLPSLPGYGFSGQPTELGWENGRIARAWAQLMDRLGYTRYVAQGGDVGAAVTDAMGRQAPEGLIGIHVNLLALAIGLKDQLPGKSEQERAAHDALNTFTTDGFGYFLEQSTRPQTIGYSLLDSPVGLAAWMLDHDTDSYYKISRAFVDGEPVGSLTRESIVDNITLYWLTGTGASAARWYWEFGRFLAATAGQAPPAVSVPVGFTTFHGEIWDAPRSWVETVYPDLVYFNEVDRGGHFPAWEEPELFTRELRAAFRSLR